MQLGAQLVGRVAIVKRHPRGVAQIRAHAEVANRNDGRAVISKDVGICLLRLGEFIERFLFVERGGDLDAPRRAGLRDVVGRRLARETGR